MAPKTETWYMVSDDPIRIQPVNEETPTHYQTREDAGDGIVHGFHGETGTRYVVEVVVTLVAVYERPWSLVRRTANEPDPFELEEDQGT